MRETFHWIKVFELAFPSSFICKNPPRLNKVKILQTEMVIYYVIFFLHFWKNYSEQIYCLHFFNQNLPLNLIFFPHVDKMPMCTLTKVEKQKKQKKTCVIRNFLIFKISFTCTASFFSSVFLFFVFFCYIYKIWIYNFFFLLKLIIFICILTFFTRGEPFQHFFFFCVRLCQERSSTLF